MTTTQSMIETSVDRLLSRADLKAAYELIRDGRLPTRIWRDVSEAGLPLLLCAEDAGGIGAGLDDAADLARLCGAGALPVPIAESLIANWLLGLAGFAPDDRPIVPLLDVSRGSHDDHGGVRRQVPWARHSDLLLVETHNAGLRIARIAARNDLINARAANLAGEPRDTVDLSRADVASILWHDLPREMNRQGILARMALLRAALLVGAMERALQLSVAYTSDRQQFGRALSSFQVVQHTLAVMATHVAAARSAVSAAAIEGEPDRLTFMAAVAKARASEAAGIVAASAHQVHGAMGFTQEYSLGLATKRLWSWRNDDGSERYWQEWLGKRAREAGDVWTIIAA